VPYLSRQRHFLGAVNLERRLKKQAWRKREGIRKGPAIGDKIWDRGFEGVGLLWGISLLLISMWYTGLNGQGLPNKCASKSTEETNAIIPFPFGIWLTSTRLQKPVVVEY
jgi:hypothetical protein